MNKLVEDSALDGCLCLLVFVIFCVHFFSQNCLPSEEGVFAQASSVIAGSFLPALSVLLLSPLVNFFQGPVPGMVEQLALLVQLVYGVLPRRYDGLYFHVFQKCPALLGVVRPVGAHLAHIYALLLGLFEQRKQLGGVIFVAPC